MTEVNPALVVFAFNRPDHLRRTLESLEKAEGVSDLDLHIFIDGPRDASDVQKVLNVREIASNANFGKSLTITAKETNSGLANSVIEGVSFILEKYQSVIVLEDDLLVNKLFLKYMREALTKYVEVDDVLSVSGYNYPLRYRESDPDYYLSHRSSSWGWGTWKDSWSLVDWSCGSFKNLKNDRRQIHAFNQGGDDLFELLDMQMSGKIDSWSIRFDYAHFEQKSYCLHPKYSFVENIGFDGTGTHPASKKLFKPARSISDISDYLPIPSNLKYSEVMQRRFDAYFRPKFLGGRYIKRFIYKLIRVSLRRFQ